MVDARERDEGDFDAAEAVGVGARRVVLRLDECLVEAVARVPVLPALQIQRGVLAIDGVAAREAGFGVGGAVAGLRVFDDGVVRAVDVVDWPRLERRARAFERVPAERRDGGDEVRGVEGEALRLRARQRSLNSPGFGKAKTPA